MRASASSPLDGDDGDTGRDAERAVPWSALDVLVKGSPMLKFGRSGDPHFRHFFLDQRCEYLLWMTHKKASAESRVRLAGCTLAEGQTTGVFRRQRRADLEDVSFSLLYAPSGQKASARGEQRSLDVACKDRREYEAWVRWCCSRPFVPRLRRVRRGRARITSRRRFRPPPQTVALRFLIDGPPPAALLLSSRRCVPRTTRPCSTPVALTYVSFRGSPTPRLSSCAKRRCGMSSTEPSTMDAPPCVRSVTTHSVRPPPETSIAAFTGA